METVTSNTKFKKSDYEKYFQKGIDYKQYKLQMVDDFISQNDSKIKEYINLNQFLMQKVEKTYNISASMNMIVKNIKYKAKWLILTEHWCSDGSQTIPAFNKIAEMSEGKIEMKLLYRDQNPELIDAYLTDQTRSIPKLIQLNEHFTVTGIWGPRPTVAQQLVKKLKSDPTTANSYTNDLHLWYAKDRQRSLETEITKLIFRANFFCSDCLS